MTSSDAPQVQHTSGWRQDNLLSAETGRHPVRFRSDGSILEAPVAFVPAAAPPAIDPREVGRLHSTAEAAPLPGQEPSDTQALIVAPARGGAESGDVEPATAGRDHAATIAIEQRAFEDALAEARARGRDEGLAEGLKRAREEGEQTLNESRQRLEALMAAISEQVGDGRQFYRPLEKLALHIASELVRGTLAISPSIVERLVELCLGGLRSGEGKLTVRLNPEDAALLRGTGHGLPNDVEIVTSTVLSRGSVIVEAAGKFIEDMLEDRVKTLARGLLAESPPESGIRMTPGDEHGAGA